jgi:hypothetical protein
LLGLRLPVGQEILMIHVVFSSDLTAAVRRFGSIRRRNQPEPAVFAFRRGWRAGCDNSSTITFFRSNNRSSLDQNFHPPDGGMKKGKARGRGFGGQLGESAQKFTILPISIAQLVIFNSEALHGGSLAWDGIDSPGRCRARCRTAAVRYESCFARCGSVARRDRRSPYRSAYFCVIKIWALVVPRT